MTGSSIRDRPNPLATLRRFAQRTSPVERCEFCSVALEPAHRHLLEADTRKLICACDPCALRFENVVGGRWKLIPRQIRALPGFRMSDSQWEAFSLPINLAFIFNSAPGDRPTALYPSPAGATESLLPLDQWNPLVSENPDLGAMQPGVEALLLNRLGAARDHYVAPIDVCYELAGLIRLRWKGLSGGEQVWKAIEDFFVNIRAQAEPSRLPPQPSAIEVAHA